MEQLLQIPKTGRYGDGVDSMNTNFGLIYQALVALSNSTAHDKGVHNSVSALQSAVPSPAVGDYAVVNVSGTYYNYSCSTAGTWTQGDVYTSGTDMFVNVSIGNVSRTPTNVTIPLTFTTKAGTSQTVNITLPAATLSFSGLMSAADKAILSTFADSGIIGAYLGDYEDSDGLHITLNTIYADDNDNTSEVVITKADGSYNGLMTSALYNELKASLKTATLNISASSTAVSITLSGVKNNDTPYTVTKTIPLASSSEAGLLSPSDKELLEELRYNKKVYVPFEGFVSNVDFIDSDPPTDYDYIVYDTIRNRFFACVDAQSDPGGGPYTYYSEWLGCAIYFNPSDYTPLSDRIFRHSNGELYTYSEGTLIGSEGVSYGKEQSLTASQQAQARSNIGIHGGESIITDITQL